MMRMILISLVATATLSGCGALEKLKQPKAEPVAPVVTMPALGAGQSAEALDASSAAEKAAAAAPVAGGRALGTAVVALGSPAEQGFWVKSALVAAKSKGRVVTGGGATVNVDLLPGSGAATLSLAAFRALGLGLTDLPEVTIYAE